MARRAVDANFALQREHPPIPVRKEDEALYKNLEEVKAKKDGEWYRVALFDSAHAGFSRASTLRKNVRFRDLEFRGGKVANDSKWRTGLWCRYAGPPNGEEAARVGPGRPPAKRV